MLKNVDIATRNGQLTIIPEGDWEYSDQCFDGFVIDLVNLCEKPVQFSGGSDLIQSDYQKAEKVKDEMIVEQMKRYHDAAVILDQDEILTSAFLANMNETIFSVAQKNNLMILAAKETAEGFMV